MLAGYLPFDDDPENPDGDNINQLYKYITTTPLTFPEYVTPHARDLLRRILVADPRKRADLFEVARHSWLSDFAHVVAQVTSSTTTVGEIANTTVDAGRIEVLDIPRCRLRLTETQKPSSLPASFAVILFVNQQRPFHLQLYRQSAVSATKARLTLISLRRG